ncbi:hypothetical protein DICPUDRAFT_77138 [Dictyostelium purpureum]|uniref:DNA polymerase II subunit 2 n=1 Tax=Dictyostelium purpureum TaxID=5786 RepID=F0ZFQ1_DICPU|nr:uncharacterized protein DICPUDRAFT_77138 [Dictyostelium purpureum]EGC37193.1 hypothetical protein DICPUDRAFT_77138 [Dictyostelium purpureum]|eukprot:XP_003286244.1 hypothetical protein DICPUDRAFT_77138 [Dictyostelium purpureum]
MDIQWKKQITKSFSLVGLSTKADAMKLIINKIKSEGHETNIALLIDEILKHLDKNQLNNNIIDQIAIEKCFKLIESLNSSDAIEKDALKVIDAFDSPLFTYDTNTKQFLKCENFEKSLHGSSKSKSDVYRRRYQMVLQRIERAESFSAPVLQSDKNKGDYQAITPLSSLLGSYGRKHILGTISVIEEDQFYIEDLNTKVKIEIPPDIEIGLITINTIIRASGEYLEGTFIADKIELPPKEEREISLKLLQNIDMFGERPQKKTLEQLERYEKEVDNTILFLSDIWLDSERVRERLDYLFSGYEEYPPFAIVLMGNFTEHPLINGTQYDLKKNFNLLATLILKYPNIHKFTQFIFVPGPTDPTGSLLNILPKLPIPNVFVKEFQSKIPKSIFTTNPCRIRYCTQEIIIFRDDLTNKMRRHCIIQPSNNCHISQHLLESIWSNSHLCNLTLEDKPIYWNYDHSMSLYPLPDLLVIGDKALQYEHSYCGTLSMNPSSFSTDYSFISYSTARRECGFSKCDPNNINNESDEDDGEMEEENKDEMIIDENEERLKSNKSKKIKNAQPEINSLEDDYEAIDQLENEELIQEENEDDIVANSDNETSSKPFDANNNIDSSDDEGIESPLVESNHDDFF